MTRRDITRPVGLESPCAEVESVCENAQIYRHCGLKPSHLVIPLDPCAERTAFLEYMADMYRESGVMSFNCGPDDYIELTLDGSLPQLRRAFAAVDSAAVYANHYSNIVGMDVSAVAQHLGETQLIELLRGSKRVCEHACVVFFVRSAPSRNEQRLIEKLCEYIGNVKRIDDEPYVNGERSETK